MNAAAKAESLARYKSLFLTQQGLRNLARRKPCMMRLNRCNGDPETTVLAHIRRDNVGMSTKGIDLFGVWACSTCHDMIDGRCNAGEKATDAEILRGIARTQTAIMEELGL